MELERDGMYPFESDTRDAWLERAAGDLRGRDPDDVLRWSPAEGVEVAAYYTRDDADAPAPVGRGTAWKGGILVGSDPELLAAAADEGLFDVPSTLLLPASAATADLLETLDRTEAETTIEAGGDLGGLLEAGLLTTALDALLHDPVASGLGRGYLPDEDWDEIAALLERDDLPRRLLCADARRFHDAAATPVQEVGLALALLAEQLDHLTEAGLAPAEILGRTTITCGVDTTFFPEVAKVRALRRLLVLFGESYDAVEAARTVPIWAITSGRGYSHLDLETNLLRHTTEALSAVLGGADRVLVRPHRPSGPLAERLAALRLARNVPLILREEAHLDAVEDPTAGAYYVEELTDQIAEAAWSYFRETESRGGLLADLRSGALQSTLRRQLDDRDTAVARRKVRRVGVTNYATPDPDRHTLDTDASAEPSGGTIDPLRTRRDSETMEQIVADTMHHRSEHGEPSVQPLIWGPARTASARHTFAENVLRAGALECRDALPSDTLNEAIEASKSDADLILLCSADEEYTPEAIGTCRAQWPEAVIVVAGRPKDRLDELRDAGADHFVYLGMDLVEMLRALQHDLGIETTA